MVASIQRMGNGIERRDSHIVRLMIFNLFFLPDPNVCYQWIILSPYARTIVSVFGVLYIIITYISVCLAFGRLTFFVQFPARHVQTSAFGAPIFEQCVRLFRPNAIAIALALWLFGVLQFILLPDSVHPSKAAFYEFSSREFESCSFFVQLSNCKSRLTTQRKRNS